MVSEARERMVLIGMASAMNGRMAVLSEVWNRKLKLVSLIAIKSGGRHEAEC
jgi:hypothetical protein